MAWAVLSRTYSAMSHACAICGEPVAEGPPTRTCSSKCRVAQWRQTREQAVGRLQGAVTHLQGENQRLRQRLHELEALVGELTHLVGQLKTRWARR